MFMSLFSGPVLVLQYDVQGVDDAWDVSKDGEEDVNEEVCIAAAL